MNERFQNKLNCVHAMHDQCDQWGFQGEIYASCTFCYDWEDFVNNWNLKINSVRLLMN